MSQIAVYKITSGVNTTYHTDGADAVELLDAITIAGGTNVNTAGAAATVTINLDDAITLTTVNATTFDTRVAAAHVTLSGTTLEADGTDPNININITPQGTGLLVVNSNALIADSIAVINQTASATSPAYLSLGKDRTGGAVVTGDVLGYVSIGGHDGTGYLDCATILSTSSGTIATDRIAANLEFYTRPDSVVAAAIERMEINSAGNVIIASPDAGLGLEILGGGSRIYGGSLLESPSTVFWNSASAVGPLLGLTKTRSGGVITTGDKLGDFNFIGHDGTTLEVGAAIKSVSSGTIATNRIPANLEFYTHADAAADDPIKRMDIATTGAVTIAAADAASIELTVTGIIAATTFDTNVAAAAVTLTGTTLSADGTDPNININITAKGTGQVIIDDLQLTTDLAVTEGGTGASTLTDGGVLIGAGVGAVEFTALGGAGTILTGVAGANPTWTTASYPATAAIGTILVASGANTITTLAPDTAGKVLTDGGAGVAPSWQTPTVGVVTSIGNGTNTTVTGTAAVPIVNLDAAITLTTVNATTFDTNIAAAGVTLAGTSLIADGTDPNININITSKGTGKVIIDDLQLTTDLAVTEGGTGVSTFTDGGVLIGAGAAAVEVLAVGGVGTILTGVAGANPTWTTATYPATAAIGTILVASGANTITTLAPDTAGKVLTDGGAGIAPSWQAPATAGTVTSVSGGTNISASGTATDPVMDLDAALTGMTSVTMSTGGSIQTGTTATNTLLVQAYDTNLTGYVPFITLTAADTPTCDLSADVTIGTKYIYRADGTDVSVADGGTGAGTFTSHGILLGNTTSAITATNELANGELLIGSGGNPPVLSTITAGAGISIANAAGSITVTNTETSLAFNDQTASYQLVAGDAGKLVTMTHAANALTLTVPKHDTAVFAVGTQILIYRGGAGTVTLAAEDANIEIHSPGGLLALYATYSVAALVKLVDGAPDIWSLSGDLS